MVDHQKQPMQHKGSREQTAPEIELSVVIPVYEEEQTIRSLYDELSTLLNTLSRPYEVIVIDDGSTDGSFAQLQRIHEEDAHWRVIRFRRNFGQAAALAAGFAYARGQIVVTMDADLQNDPRDIPKLLEKLDEGYDIVSGWRTSRQEPLITRRLPSMIANRLISKMTGVYLHDYGCTLKVYRTEVVKNLALYGELHRFIPAMASAFGVTVAEVPVHDRARQFGKSKYGIGRTARVVLDLITVSFLLNYATRPLHIFGGLGLIVGSVGTLIGLYLTFLKLALGRDIGDRPLLLLGKPRK